MAISTGQKSQLTYITEVTWGTTPGTPQMIGLPFTSANLNLTKATFSDNSILADRMQRYQLFGNQTVAGDLDVNLSHGNFDPLLESCLNSSFTANVLKVGSTRKSFTFEIGHLDIAQYKVFTGITVDKMTISVPANNLVTAKFGLIGKGSTISGTPLDATITAAGAKQPYTHIGGTINEGGSAIAILTAITLNVDNSTDANFALGSTTPRDLTVDLCQVNGSVTAYFEDAVLYNKFIAATSTSIAFTLTDGTNTLQFSIPKVYYTGANNPIAGQGPVVITLPFVGIWDSGTSSNLVITRS